jgi:hypothetical protein
MPLGKRLHCVRGAPLLVRDTEFTVDLGEGT